jgi:lipopolysaccharide/colanic/teichoic acid biosynthesis glycosyltransferase
MTAAVFATRPIRRVSMPRWKRTLDVVLCLVAMPVLVPVAVLVALAIRIDSPGAVMFPQWRTGRDGTRFKMLKFRTMVHDAEERKAELAHLNILPPPDFKIPDDPRITRVGRVLRRTSLDELPQVINVLRGDMTLVGPRPTSFAASTYSLWHTARLDATPGITGLWQVTARGTSSFDVRLRLDLEYLEKMSLLTDLRILWRTVSAVLDRSGA